LGLAHMRAWFVVIVAALAREDDRTIVGNWIGRRVSRLLACAEPGTLDLRTLC